MPNKAAVARPSVDVHHPNRLRITRVHDKLPVGRQCETEGVIERKITAVLPVGVHHSHLRRTECAALAVLEDDATPTPRCRLRTQPTSKHTKCEERRHKQHNPSHPRRRYNNDSRATTRCAQPTIKQEPERA